MSKIKNKTTGTLADWQEDGNYGFISLSSGPEQAFLHISDLEGEKVPSKRDILAFDLEDTEEGLRALNAEIVT